MSIKFVPAICPNCNGELRVPDDRRIVKCMYCGYDIIIHETKDDSQKSKVANWLKLADSVKGSNFEEAYNYYSKVLEVEPENYKAWFGKALMTCKLSKLDKPRADEIINLVRISIDLCHEEMTDQNQQYKKLWLDKDHPYEPKSVKDELLFVAGRDIYIVIMNLLMESTLRNPPLYTFFEHCEPVFSLIDFLIEILPKSNSDYLSHPKLGIQVCGYISQKMPPNKKVEHINKVITEKSQRYRKIITQLER